MRSALRLFLLVVACSGATRVPNKPSVDVAPPVAEQRPFEVVSPHGTRVDPYYWLRDDKRKDKAVLAYLAAENRYTAAQLASTAALQEKLFKEIVGRIQEDDSTVPVLDNGYWYYTRYETGKQYPIHARKKGSLDAREEIVLDGNALAGKRAFYRIGDYEVTPDGRLVAWAEDSVGRNQYVLRIKDLTTGELLADTAQNIAPSLAWANDNRTLFYVGKDAITLRESLVYRHLVGSEEHPLVYEETDTAFYAGVSKTKSDAYVTIELWSTMSTEVQLIDANHPETAPRVFFPRERNHEYEIDHLDGRFVILTNWEAKNFRLMYVAAGKESDRSAWRDIVAHSKDVLIEGFAVYGGFLAVHQRSGGLLKIRILPSKGQPFFVDADEATYGMKLIDTPDAASTRARYVYFSMTTPRTTYEMDIKTRERAMLKREVVRGKFVSGDYVTEYLHAKARDGTQVPISIVRKKTTMVDGTAPMLIYGYGSYGASSDPSFDHARLSLLDRGWVYAIAHVRGGQELGRAWYEAGRQMNKKNTFTDFIDCTEYLVTMKHGARDKVFAAGGSAGGMLIGAIVNLRPELYRGVIAWVPFVDVVTTMLDETIPLTTNEFDEWGNPRDKGFYDYMLSYSPYDNVEAKAYPSMLVATGLWDSQVQYFEPAKWVAKLRAKKTDDNLLLLYTEMEAGHGGRSGRYDELREVARDFAFLLLVLERPDTRK